MEPPPLPNVTLYYDILFAVFSLVPKLQLGNALVLEALLPLPPEPESEEAGAS